MTATQEANKALIRRTYEEALNLGDLTNVEAFVHPDFVDHEEHGTDRGPESLRALVRMLRTAFPDLHFTVEELIAEGEMVAGRFTMRGTHQGALMGLPPTGRTVKQSHMHFFRFQDGKAVEHWGLRDDVGIMQQLGIAPKR
jgi:steroid delta-isomerase-like uncharacterized protein